MKIFPDGTLIEISASKIGISSTRYKGNNVIAISIQSHERHVAGIRLTELVA